MRLYLIYHHGNPHYVATLAEARDYVRQLPTAAERTGVAVDQVEVGTDKANLIRILNSYGGFQDTERSWNGTPRGGLRETNLTEA